MCMGNMFGQSLTEIADEIATFYHLVNLEATIQKNQQKNKKIPKASPENSIWKEKEESNTERMYFVPELLIILLYV